MDEEEDFQKIDRYIDPWAQKREVVFEKEYKGYAVRSFWIEGKLQLWIDAPDAEGYVRVHLAELKTGLPSKWGRKIEWRTTYKELAGCLEEVLAIGKSWL